MGLVVLCEPLPRRPIIAENAARVLRLRVNLLMPRRPLHLFVFQLDSKRTARGFRRILEMFSVDKTHSVQLLVERVIVHQIVIQIGRITR